MGACRHAFAEPHVTAAAAAQKDLHTPMQPLTAWRKCTFFANSALSWYSCARSSRSAGISPDSRSALFVVMSGSELSLCDRV